MHYYIYIYAHSELAIEGVIDDILLSIVYLLGILCTLLYVILCGHIKGNSNEMW